MNKFWANRFKYSFHLPLYCPKRKHEILIEVKNSRGKFRQVNYCMKWRKKYGLQGNTYQFSI